MNHHNQLEQMANGAMFATISPFFVIYDNTSKASTSLQKLTQLEPLTLAWMLTIIQTPPRSTFPLFIFSSYVHILPLWSHTLETTSLLWSHILPIWNKISETSKTKGLQEN
jgi:hypothetical protein